MAVTLMPIWQGVKEKKWPVSKGGQLICRYNYFYVLASDLGVAWNLKWYITSVPEQEISYERVRELFPNKTPHLGLWERYALIIVLMPVIFLMLLGY